MSYCSVKTCTNNGRKNEKHLKFYSFPQDFAMAKKWIEVCGNPILNENNYRMYRVCSTHFDGKYLIKHPHEVAYGLKPHKFFRNLSKDAIPTLNLPETITHLQKENISSQRSITYKSELDMEHFDDIKEATTFGTQSEHPDDAKLLSEFVIKVDTTTENNEIKLEYSDDIPEKRIDEFEIKTEELDIKTEEIEDEDGGKTKSSFECELCDKSLINHTRSHTGEKCYKCEVCNKAFFRKVPVSLIVGEKPYKCEICEKRFARKNTMDKYVIESHKTSKHCDICKISFTSKSAFVAHSRIHAGKELIKCEVCNKCFRTKQFLKINLTFHNKLQFKNTFKNS